MYMSGEKNREESGNLKWQPCFSSSHIIFCALCLNLMNETFLNQRVVMTAAKIFTYVSATWICMFV